MLIHAVLNSNMLLYMQIQLLQAGGHFQNCKTLLVKTFFCIISFSQCLLHHWPPLFPGGESGSSGLGGPQCRVTDRVACLSTGPGSTKTRSLQGPLTHSVYSIICYIHSHVAAMWKPYSFTKWKTMVGWMMEEISVWQLIERFSPTLEAYDEPGLSCSMRWMMSLVVFYFLSPDPDILLQSAFIDS